MVGELRGTAWDSSIYARSPFECRMWEYDKSLSSDWEPWAEEFRKKENKQNKKMRTKKRKKQAQTQNVKGPSRCKHTIKVFSFTAEPATVMRWREGYLIFQGKRNSSVTWSANLRSQTDTKGYAQIHTPVRFPHGFNVYQGSTFSTTLSIPH